MKDKEPCAAVYGLYCRETNKWYVGASQDVKRRFREHLSAIRRGRHFNGGITRDSDKDFTTHILEVVEARPGETAGEHYYRLLAREAWWIVEKDALNSGYNTTPPAGYALVGAGLKPPPPPPTDEDRARWEYVSKALADRR